MLLITLSQKTLCQFSKKPHVLSTKTTLNFPKRRNLWSFIVLAQSQIKNTPNGYRLNHLKIVNLKNTFTEFTIKLYKTELISLRSNQHDK